MKRWQHSFNIYFALLCLVLTGGGCAAFKGSNSSKKDLSTIRLYLEGQRADSTTAAPVLVTRSQYRYIVDREPFLDEGDLSQASIVDDPDGTFYIQLSFNNHGTLLLDMNTASNKGKHIIVFAQFPSGAKPVKHKKKTNDPDDSDVKESNEPEYPPGTPRQSGWLAAVLIRDRISNGTFRFTPDASHAEGVRIVRGLRNVIAKNSKDTKD